MTTRESVDVASNDRLSAAAERMQEVMDRLGTGIVTYEQLEAAGYDFPTLVGGPQPTAHDIARYVESGQVVSGICWCSPYVTRALEAGRNPAEPETRLTGIPDLAAFARRYLPEADQILDELGGVITGSGDPDELVLFYESELFARKVADITGFDLDAVRDVVDESYDRIARAAEQFVRHKNRHVRVVHVRLDRPEHETLRELMREDEREMVARASTAERGVRPAAGGVESTDAPDLRMEPRGSYGTAEANASVSLLTATGRQLLDVIGVDVAARTTIVSNHSMITDQNYGRRWWRDRSSIYAFDLQTAPAGRGGTRNAPLVHVGTLPMLNPFANPNNQPVFVRSTPSFEASDREGRARELRQWIDRGNVVPTAETLNPATSTEWVERLREADSPAPTVRYLTASPAAWTVVNFSPESVPPAIDRIVTRLRSGTFVAGAKHDVAQRNGVPSFEALPDEERGPELGKEVRRVANERRHRVWDRPPSSFFEAGLVEAEAAIGAMYDGL